MTKPRPGAEKGRPPLDPDDPPVHVSIRVRTSPRDRLLEDADAAGVARQAYMRGILERAVKRLRRK